MTTTKSFAGVQVAPTPKSRYPGSLKLLSMVVRYSANPEIANLLLSLCPYSEVMLNTSVAS